MNSKVLIVDDDVNILKILRTLLEREGLEVVTASSSEKGLNFLRHKKFDLLLSDIVMQPYDGITLLRQARELNPENQVIMMTGFATIETATEALKLGAFDYICKPFKLEELLSTVRRAITYVLKLSGEGEQQEKKKVVLIKQHFGQLVGESPQMKAVYEQIRQLAKTDSTVLITGGSGTGKSLVARSLHEEGDRSASPFLTLSCASWPERFLDATLFGFVQMPTDDEGNVIAGLPVIKRGLFELAKGGTLFFEQINSLPMELQRKLVAVFREKKFCRTGSTKNIPLDIRIVADTLKPLDEKVAKNEFLKELYGYLSPHTISLPSLRERKEDLKLLVKHFIIQFNREESEKVSIDPKVRQAMEQYSWPGSVHELKSAIFRSARTCKRQRIQLDDIPVPIRMCYMKEKTSIFGYTDEFDLRWRSLKTFLKSKEREYVDEILRITKGDKEKAAKLLGVSLATFYSKYVDSK